jgi:hypothetical protein
MTNLTTVPKAASRGLVICLIVTLSWLPSAYAQKSTEGIDEKSFRELVTKFRDWKVDSAWGDVSKEDQKEYKYTPLAAISFASNNFDAIDKQGKHTKGKWIKDTYTNPHGGGNAPSVSLNFSKRTRYLIISNSSIAGAKPYLVLQQDVCIECLAWYRLRPK